MQLLIRHLGGGLFPKRGWRGTSGALPGARCALLGYGRFCSGQQRLVRARATEQLVLMNRPMMEGSRFGPQMNRGLSGRLLGRLAKQHPRPPPAPPPLFSTCLHGLCGLTSQHWPICSPRKRKKKKFFEFGEMERRSPVILLILSFSWKWSFSNAAHLFNCHSRLSNGWDSGPVIEHPLTALPPLRLPALPMRTVPIPRRHTAGTAFTPCEDRDILCRVGRRKGEMRRRDEA